jgi:hypothetical protein
MTNPSLQEIDEQFDKTDKTFSELDNNKIFRDFCEKHAPDGMFHELHDDNLQSMIAELLAERDEALRKEIKKDIEKNGWSPEYVAACHNISSLLSKE